MSENKKTMNEETVAKCGTCANDSTEPQAEESVMKFPMEFPIKIMGLTRDDYVSTIEAEVRKFAPDLDSSLSKVEYSSTKKYTALTVVVNATSREQLDNLYMALTKHPFVKVVL